MLGEAVGEASVRLARGAVAQKLGRPATLGPARALPAVFGQPRGAFVTLKQFPGGSLRGCIGYPMPALPLGRAVAGAAIAAAFDDPRFPPLAASELPAVTFEVSLLTVPVPVSGDGPEAIAAGIHVGRDGLIVECGARSGLLLPQVAPEQGWSAEEFLDGTCEKAGLPPRAWRRPATRVRRFEAEVFVEVEPEGRIVTAGSEAPRSTARRAPRR